MESYLTPTDSSSLMFSSTPTAGPPPGITAFASIEMCSTYEFFHIINTEHI